LGKIFISNPISNLGPVYQNKKAKKWYLVPPARFYPRYKCPSDLHILRNFSKALHGWRLEMGLEIGLEIEVGNDARKFFYPVRE
jgi:hypothetical protein